MDWKEYLHQFSRLLVLRNGVGNTMEILGEVDNLHWSAVQSGKTDEAFIAEFGPPETAARELAAERSPRRYSERARFGVGIALLCLVVLLCQTRLSYPGKENWVPLFLSALVPLALWGLLEVRTRLVVDLFAEQKKRWYGGWVGIALTVLLMGYIVGVEFWYSLLPFQEPYLFGMVSLALERITILLALVGVVRGLWDVYLCRVDGFPACCLWLGIYCTQALALRPLRSMNMAGTELGMLYMQIPAIVCLVLTVALAILLRLVLKKLRGEVKAQWTHS